MNQYILTLPKPISANKYWRSIVIKGQVRVLVSKEAKQFKEMVAMIALGAGVRKPIAGRVQIDYRLYPPRPLDYKKRQAKDPLNWDDNLQCIDLDNAGKILLDSIKNIVIEDDKMVWSMTAQRMEPDEDGYRVVVKITKLHQDNPQQQLSETA